MASLRARPQFPPVPYHTPQGTHNAPENTAPATREFTRPRRGADYSRVDFPGGLVS